MDYAESDLMDSISSFDEVYAALLTQQQPEHSIAITHSIHWIMPLTCCEQAVRLYVIKKTDDQFAFKMIL